MPDALTKSVQAAIEAAPCSMRELAKEAGISHTALSLIRTGDRSATKSVAAAVAQALARLGQRCADAERDLWETMATGGDE